MIKLLKFNTESLAHLWKVFCQIHRRSGRDTELLDMTRVHSSSSHSYTSLRDVFACSLPAASSNQRNNQLSSFQNLADIRHVHMRNPLVEKAARAYLATASHTKLEQNSAGMSSGYSSFLKILQFPLYTLFGGTSAWFKQLYIKI
uniref:Uncharacterized protein n=1 Tax=Physcomitrium patens TaxID=3218 RepID=A0A2K1L1Q8_PHYPA|nr:hypothetical protein PHYPA_002745 [Physcomitrium patens]